MNSFPIFGQFSNEAADFIFPSRKPLVILLTDDRNIKQFNIVKQVALAMKGRILFTWSGVSEDHQTQLGELTGMLQKDLPAIRILEADEDSSEKFKPTWNFDEMSVDNLTSFIESYFKRDNEIAKPYF